ncbi:MAG: transposase [Parachlamydiaceae bacterium]|nr:transposase [Parachlamydiaceae bacterium]
MDNWPHAPLHKTLVSGTYMVTAGTYNKVLHFHTPDRLQFLHDTLLELCKIYNWQLQAWAVLSNHYHFVAQSPQDPKNLSGLISQIHVTTAKYVNAADQTPNRKVWWQYWDSRITYQYSYLARLNYVNQNPVKHGLVGDAIEYPWCSANWFQKSSPTSFCKTVSSFKIDTVKVMDDF